MLTDLQGEKISKTFYESGLLKTNQNKFRIEQVIRKNKNLALVKWSGCSSKFNSWVSTEDLEKCIKLTNLSGGFQRGFLKGFQRGTNLTFKGHCAGTGEVTLKCE